MTNLALATVDVLRMLLVRSNDHSAWSPPLVRRVSGEMTVLPTGFDVLTNHVLKGRAAKAISALLRRVILSVLWQATLLDAIHSPRGGQQQRGPVFDLVHQRLRAVATGYGPHAQLASRAEAAVRASAEGRRVLLA